jgi:hypothetical protein
LFRYVGEQALRFNERRATDKGRFMTEVKGIIGGELNYGDMIVKGRDDFQQEVQNRE